MKNLMSKFFGSAVLISALSLYPDEGFSQNDDYEGFLNDSVSISHSVKDPDNDSFPENVISRVSYKGEDYVVLKKEDKNGDNVHDYVYLGNVSNRFIGEGEKVKHLDDETAYEIVSRQEGYAREKSSEIYRFSKDLDTLNSGNLTATLFQGAEVSKSYEDKPIDSLSNEGVSEILSGSGGPNFGTYSVDDYLRDNVQKLDSFLRKDFYDNVFIGE